MVIAISNEDSWTLEVQFSQVSDVVDQPLPDVLHVWCGLHGVDDQGGLPGVDQLLGAGTLTQADIVSFI